MKVVINTRHGGFSLGRAALERLCAMGHPEAIRERLQYEEDQGPCDNMFFLSINRADPDLIAVVEELGSGSWGDSARLKVVEVPDDVEWDIVNYDGMEHVAERHRIWE